MDRELLQNVNGQRNLFTPIEYFSVSKSIVEKWKNGWKLLLGGVCRPQKKEGPRQRDSNCAFEIRRLRFNTGIMKHQN